MKTFLAINIIGGIKSLPSFRDHCSRRSTKSHLLISQLMPLHRFRELLSTLHLNDNTVMPPPGSASFDKLYKLRPHLERLKSTSAESFASSRNQSIDESVIRFKGRCSFKQYMPMKLIKRGCKVWTRADDSGYICQFEVYAGKPSTTSSECELGQPVGSKLSLSLKDKNYHIFFNNCFSSVPLMKFLTQNQIYGTGTVRSNRKLLPSLKPALN